MKVQKRNFIAQTATLAIYPGKYIRNIRDKSNTFTVEGVNADLRCYIPILKRRSRCFPRSLETLKTVPHVFVNAYNRYHGARLHFSQTHNKREFPLELVVFLKWQLVTPQCILNLTFVKNCAILNLL